MAETEKGHGNGVIVYKMICVNHSRRINIIDDWVIDVEKRLLLIRNFS